jgi:hypothetical protein
MGNNNYQFRLQSLEVLDDYIAKLKQEEDFYIGYPMTLKQIHESYAESDKWNDIKHTEYLEETLNDVILESQILRQKIEEAISRLNQLKNIYANAGVN